jgi:hypothetical protein
MKQNITLDIPADVAERFTSAVAARDPELEQYVQSALRRKNRILASTGMSGYRLSTDEALVQLEKTCVCFHRMAQQLLKRRENRPTLEITDEYDVQDLFHAILLLDFPDVRKEEWNPSYAGGATRSDFLLKPQETIIEIKKTRKGLGAREVGEQLIVDIEKYKGHPSCSNLVCFVYDPEHLITNPCGIENDLSGVRGDMVIIVIISPKGV